MNKMVNCASAIALLEAMGFKNNAEGYKKAYPQHKCSIVVDISAEKVIYPADMHVHDQTTSNFSREENFVVLECVDRLMEKGYSPDCIELEKSWSLGRNNKGKLDILVKEKDDDRSYLMIECKTFGDQFDKEQEKMRKEGGQLFSYWQQDRDAKLLCLYTSRFHASEIEYDNRVVFIDSNMRDTSNVEEAYAKWNKDFSTKGVFEEEATAYQLEFEPLKKCDLKPLKEEDGQRIYQQFLQILRHNIVSDKGNAFNKIFNLFLCKIRDEDRSDDEELDFQWVEGRDDAEILLGRLTSLYKEGMSRYLSKDITDYSEDDVNSRKSDDDIRRIIKELRLYKNQEFAFVDVFNKQSFEENASIVIEVVKLLQGWKIRYTQKQQFLGEFFELLLNTGFKQESGQFFTPVPLVRFILDCLPIENIIQKKIKRKEDKFLPYIIDFACGSGHFLTESMDFILKEIKKIGESKLIPSQTKRRRGYLADEFGWAKEYIYGIERDYRLAKTSKLATFLNGDGDAVIVHASGIDSFSSYNVDGILKADDKFNECFDILVANPPYTIKGFKSTVKDGGESFDLFSMLTEKSDEIEVLFLERMCQLITSKHQGVVGIILPQSILAKPGIYQHARQMIFENFHLKGIVKLGSNAFSATGIKTVILFLVKRKEKITIKDRDYFSKICANEKAVVLIDSGEGDDEKRFLGYQFSNRKGSEGIKMLQTSTLDEVSRYVRHSMLDKSIPSVDKKLKNHVRVVAMKDLFDFSGDDYNSIIINKKKLELTFSSANLLVPMKSCIRTLESGSRPKGGSALNVAGVGSLGGEHIDRESGTISTKKMKFVPQEFYNLMTKGHVKRGDILLCKDGAQTGKLAYYDDVTNYCVNEHLFIIRSNEKVCDQKYMFYFMMSSFFQEQVKALAYNNMAQPGMNVGHFNKIKFLKIPKSKQKAISKKADKIWKKHDIDYEGKISLIDKVFSEAGLQILE